MMIAPEPDPRQPCPGCGVKRGWVFFEFCQQWCCGWCHQDYERACAWAQIRPKYKPTRKPRQQQLMETSIRLSHSQIEQWEKCPLAWRFTKVDKLPPAPNEHLAFGTAIHAMFEEDNKRAQAHMEALEDWELFNVYHQTLILELQKSDPDNFLKARLPVMRAKAQHIIISYIRHVQGKFTPMEIEQEFSFKLNDDISFSGRIDAVTPKAIVDWKTASKPWNDGDQHFKDQATAYLIARPDKNVVSFTIFAATPNGCDFQALPTTRTDEQKSTYRAKVLRIADEIQQAKLTGDFEAKPSTLCGHCQFLGACTAGKAFLIVQGKMPSVPVLTYHDEATKADNAPSTQDSQRNEVRA